MTKAKRRVNRMDDFEIDEISSVDKPAQESARALLMKRAEFIKQMRLTSAEESHQHIIEVGPQSGTTSYERSEDSDNGHSHPWVVGDDGIIHIGMTDGHTHTVLVKSFTSTEDLAMSLGNSQKPANSGGGQDTGDNPMTKTAEEIAAEKELAVQKSLQEATARAERAEALATLTDVQKSYFAGLTSEAQDSFLKLAPTARQGAVEKAAGDDPVVYTTLDGQDIRKSAGALVLSLAKRADESEKQLVIEKAARENEMFAKRAKQDLSNLPGDEATQVALLKAVNSIGDETLRNGAFEILKAANAAVSKGFASAGSASAPGTADTGDAQAKLNKMAQDHQTANGGSFSKSLRAVLETPAGRELYMQTR